MRESSALNIPLGDNDSNRNRHPRTRGRPCRLDHDYFFSGSSQGACPHLLQRASQSAPRLPVHEVLIPRRSSTKANWISHNYTHLLQQPTVFYPVEIMLALMGDKLALSVNLAWGYAGIRVLHSLWQANVNTIPARFALFALSGLCLITLAARAVTQAHER